jgi:acyl-coenzyme A thioesterase 13
MILTRNKKGWIPMEEEEKIKERSKKMIDLLNAITDMNLKDFPVPPFTKWLNGKVKHAEYGKVEISLVVRPEMANPTGLVHGGVQSAMLDDIIGMTTATLGLEGFLITVDFHVDFLGKAKVGDIIIASAEFIRIGKNIVNAKATLKDINGNPIALGSANLLRTTYKPDYVKNVDARDNDLNLKPT